MVIVHHVCVRWFVWLYLPRHLNVNIRYQVDGRVGAEAAIFVVLDVASMHSSIQLYLSEFVLLTALTSIISACLDGYHTYCNH